MRTAPSADVGVANTAHDRRHFTYWLDEDGSFHFRGQLSPEDGALLVRSLEEGCELARERPAEDASERGYLPHGTQMADALVRMLGEDAPRAQVVLHVDEAAIACTASAAHAAGETCTIEDGPALPSDTARRLACDAEVVIARGMPDGSLDLGRRQRIVSPQLRNDVLRRDAGRCRFPGCQRRHGLNPHHIIHWAHGGTTCLENLISLCRYHHRSVHEGGFDVARLDGKVVFLSPEGDLVEEAPRLAS